MTYYFEKLIVPADATPEYLKVFQKYFLAGALAPQELALNSRFNPS
jgi:hypothetical protein